MCLPCNQIVKVPQPLPSYPSSYSQRHANCYSPPRTFRAMRLAIKLHIRGCSSFSRKICRFTDHAFGHDMPSL